MLPGREWTNALSPLHESQTNVLAALDRAAEPPRIDSPLPQVAQLRNTNSVALPQPLGSAVGAGANARSISDEALQRQFVRGRESAPDEPVPSWTRLLPRSGRASMRVPTAWEASAPITGGMRNSTIDLDAWGAWPSRGRSQERASERAAFGEGASMRRERSRDGMPNPERPRGGTRSVAPCMFLRAGAHFEGKQDFLGASAVQTQTWQVRLDVSQVFPTFTAAAFEHTAMYVMFA